MKHNKDCQHTGNRLFRGPELSRRAFARLTGTGLVASWFLPSLAAATTHKQALDVPTLSTAKNVIFITLTGAPSHVDTFDLKEGAWTPSKLQPTSYGEIRWPRGLMPKLGDHLNKIAIVRSCLAWAAVHDIAQLWAQIARNPASALGAIAPHMGSVVSLELESRRDPARDVLPTFLSFRATSGAVLRSGGYFPSSYAPFTMPQPKPEGTPLFAHQAGNERFARRWALLDKLDGAARRDAAYGKDASDADLLYRQARALTESSDVGALMKYDQTAASRYVYERDPYGYGAMFLIAYRVLAARRGTRFIHLTGLDWDHHAEIYSEDSAQFNLRSESSKLDLALSSLITDLANTPGETAGKTLLDETLIVVGGEFGRTVGALNPSKGRDHHLRHSILFAGGGVRGGRTIGKTDAMGEGLVEAGWGSDPTRDTRAEDVAATIYSALGIDYTTWRTDDPLRRGFEYVPLARSGYYKPIDALFS
ncbi:MAG TPA: DUF1501 domain-containing protein [Thermoanaerobaculia bacterium]